MVFEIDFSVVEYLKGRAMDTKDNEVIAIQNLCSAVREGRHLLTCEFEILEFFKDYEVLDLNSRIVFQKLYYEFSSSYFYEEFEFKVVLAKNKETKNKNEYYMELEVLSNSSYLFEGVLITENLTDANFYENITKHYLRHKGLEFIKLNIDKVPGGGSQTARIFKEKVSRKNKFCFAIIDSDIKYPGCPLGSTAKGFRSLQNSLIENFYILNVREAENLIPLSIYKIQNYDNILVEDLEVNESYNLLKFLDYKEGLTLKKLSKYDEKYDLWKDYLLSSISEEWSENLIIGFGDKFLENITQILDEEAINRLRKKIEKKKKLKLEGVTSILDEHIDSLEKQVLVLERPFENIPSYLKESWIEISKSLMSYFCGREEMIMADYS